jgi:HK97 family phage portal protein
MFASLFRAAGDTADRSPWGDFWFEPVGARSLSGIRVTPDKSLQLTAVYACVRVLAESFAVMRPRFYLMSGSRKVWVTKHPVLTLLDTRPNRWQNAFEWREMLQGHLAHRGNAYNRIYANDRGVIEELVPIHPDRIKPELLGETDYRYQIRDRAGNWSPVGREEIWHIRGLGSDGILGYSPVELAREALGIGLAAQAYGGRYFANDARPSSGWIEVPGKITGKSGQTEEEAHEVLRDKWQAKYGGINRGKIPFLDNGMKYHELSVNNSDAQFLETRQFTVEEIARMFRVPPHKIGHLARSTNNNIEHQGKEFDDDTMEPWFCRWEASVEAELLFEGEGIHVEFGNNALRRATLKDRGEYLTKMVAGGIWTRNEARQEEGKDPLLGLDEPLRPLNMVPESEAEENEDQDEDPATDKDDDAGNDS